jgi:error-prone DNA polymerase
MSYVELHASSAFSFLRGAALPEHLAARAAELQLPALAVLDRDGLYGAPRVYTQSWENGIRPLVGAEVTLADGSVLPLLVQNRTGYQNLCQLISGAKLQPRPAGLAPEGLGPAEDPTERKRRCFATWAEIERHAEGLVALTGDEDGPLRRAWERGGAGEVERALAPLQRIFGPGRLHVEIQRHRVRGEETVIKMLADLAAAHGLPLLATGGALHATAEQRIVADVFACLRHHTTLDAAGRLLAANENRHLRSARQMQALFADHPEAIAQSGRLAGELEFTLQNLGYRFPDFPVPAGHSMESWLREQVYAGARLRYRVIPEAAQRQIEKELALINKLGFAGYFLIVWDICRWTREQGTLIQGRGSAANSIVCYALQITAVDPIKQKLLFERFLSEGRIGRDGHPSWPDVDLDLPSGDRREQVIQQIFTRYGERGAAMVANVITYRGRSAAREVGKVLGLGADVLDRFSALYANGDFPHTLGLKEQLRTSGLPGDHPRLGAMLAVCSYLQQNHIPRHLGQHSGGMILCPGRLDQVVPIEPATMPGRTVVQWDKDDCEDLGLVKIDFLGLGMMAVLQDCRALCHARGQPWELYEVPLDDTPTYDLMCRADTIGVFQIESRAQMATLPKIQPRTFYDVVIEVAIVRPGPIVGQVASPLLRRRAGKEPGFACIDPEVDAEVKDILDRTYGVILFQEQMLSVAMKLAGFNGTEAEELRRALGFHRSDERMERIVARLQAAMRERGRSEGVIEKVMHAAKSFALYGFPESHAFSFGLLAYVSTWLKVHHLAAFYSALLNNQPMGFYSPATLVQDGRRHGLRVRAVDVRASAWDCTVEDDKVMRVGLRYVQGLREESGRRLVAARGEQPFASLGDFLQRVPLPAHERRALAAVGAFAGLSSHRRAALWQVEAAWSAEESLFQSADLVEESMPPLEAMTLTERVQADFAGLHLTAGEHPMRLARDRLPDIWRASDLALGRDGEQVVIGGSVICRQRPGTAQGVVFISLEDETGIANAIVRSALFEKHRMVINEEPNLRITGRLQRRDGVTHVQAETIERLRLDDVPAQASHDFH